MSCQRPGCQSNPRTVQILFWPLVICLLMMCPLIGGFLVGDLLVDLLVDGLLVNDLPVDDISPIDGLLVGGGVAFC